MDVAAVTKLAKTRGKEVSGLLDELGLDGLKSIVFFSGFEGKRGTQRHGDGDDRHAQGSLVTVERQAVQAGRRAAVAAGRDELVDG